ncbi:unnamed protein product, partial [marine sediment metagenome]
DAKGIYLIEDCAEAHGAEYKGRMVGSFGNISCFSFFGNKIITTGEGGMCLTDDENLAEKMRILRSHGMSTKRKYWHDVLGFNYRMTNLQAALGVAQTERIDQLVLKKREIAHQYNRALSDIEGVVIAPEMKWAKNVFWMYSILLEDYSQHREQISECLAQEGIETRPFFIPVHMQPPHLTQDKLNVAENLSRRGMNLPSSISLESETVSEIENIIRKICA